MNSEPLSARPGDLALVGGDLALDFANTVSGRAGPAEVEHLRTSDDVVTWARYVGLLAAGDVLDHTAALLQDAIQLREAIASVAAAVSAGQAPPSQSGEAMVTAYATALRGGSANFANGRLVIIYDGASKPSPNAILGPVVAAAIKLLGELDPSRLKRCPAADCGWFFLDTTKNNSRRWCDMQVCGARSKVAAYRSRQRNMRCDGV